MIRSLVFTSFLFLSVTVFAKAQNTQIKSPPISVKTQTATASDIMSSLEKPTPKNNHRMPPLFTGSAELGFLYKTGNTRSGDMKMGVDLRLEKGSWLSLLNVDLLIKKADVLNSNGDTHFSTTDQKWTLASQTNYNIDSKERNYVYGNIWFEESEFNSFANQSSISTGWGQHWYRNNDASLWGDIGPGYKRDLFKATATEPQRTADTFIIQTQVLYIRKLGDFVELKQYISAKQALKSSANSIYKAETNIVTKLISTLQLKITFTLNYNSKVDGNKENLDTQTAMTIVYSF